MVACGSDYGFLRHIFSYYMGGVLYMNISKCCHKDEYK